MTKKQGELLVKYIHLAAEAAVDLEGYEHLASRAREEFLESCMDERDENTRLRAALEPTEENIEAYATAFRQHEHAIVAVLVAIKARAGL